MSVQSTAVCEDNSLPSSDRPLPLTSDQTPDYQKLVNKLHDLAIEKQASCVTDDQCATIPEVQTPPASPINNQLGNESNSCNVKVNIPAISISSDEHGFTYIRYESELQMPDIMSLISKDLSEPYSIYTYRYFIHNWPHLCYLAKDGPTTIGAIVCKLDPHKRTLRKRGYIAMLAIDHSHRRKGIGSKLVSIAIDAMIQQEADEVVLETEVTNLSALRLYEKLGFVRDKRLYKYYLNGVDAFRLKLWLT